MYNFHKSRSTKPQRNTAKKAYRFFHKRMFLCHFSSRHRFFNVFCHAGAAIREKPRSGTIPPTLDNAADAMGNKAFNMNYSDAKEKLCFYLTELTNQIMAEIFSQSIEKR